MAVLLALDRPAEALAACDRILAIDPRDLDTLYNRAVVLSRLRRFEEALVVYDKVLARDRGLVAALFDRGNVLAELARFKEAVACYEQVLAKARRMSARSPIAATCLAQARPAAEALASYDQVLAIKPGDINALGNRGGRAQGARPLRRGDGRLRAGPGAAIPMRSAHWLRAATSWSKLARYEEAWRASSGRWRRRPAMSMCSTISASCSRSCRRSGEALAFFDRALAIDPGAGRRARQSGRGVVRRSAACRRRWRATTGRWRCGPIMPKRSITAGTRWPISGATMRLSPRGSACWQSIPATRMRSVRSRSTSSWSATGRKRSGSRQRSNACWRRKAR